MTTRMCVEKCRSLQDAKKLAALGQSIRRIRKARNTSQEALAYMTDIDRSHMGKIERGERNITLLNIVRIAEALDEKPSEILSAAGL